MKRLLSLFLVCSLALSTVITAGARNSSSPFTDVSGHFSAPYVQLLQEKCLLSGMKDSSGNPLGIFKPDNTITRAELSQMLFQCQNQSILPATTFPDVRNTDWFASAVTLGTQQGWINGYPDNTFRPYNLVNRAEALKMISSSAPEKIDMSLPVSPAFSDVRPNDWFAPYVTFARDAGFIQGRLPGKFVPDGNLTRGEAAKLVAMLYFFPRVLQDTNQNTNSTLSSGTLFHNCPVFPSDNPWNTDISNAPVHPNSDGFISSINSKRKFLHPDFGSNPDYGIPFVTVTGTQAKVPITAYYPDETDPGPYPIPDNAPVEAGGDKHVLVVDTDNCVLYEMYDSVKTATGWEIGSGAIFNLLSNALRPDYWTSADAAGLPIFPGLVKYDEVKSGKITHALRFTVSKTQRGFIHPATHFASNSTDADLPPMGLRLRLKKDFDISAYTGDTRVILEALQTYGMIVADNGSDWFISGATDSRWDDDDLSQLKKIPGSAFEAVDTGPIIK